MATNAGLAQAIVSAMKVSNEARRFRKLSKAMTECYGKDHDKVIVSRSDLNQLRTKITEMRKEVEGWKRGDFFQHY